MEEFGFAEYGLVRYVHKRTFVGVEFRFEWASQEQLERWKKVVKTVEERSARP
jgi:hypothetical protein